MEKILLAKLLGTQNIISFTKASMDYHNYLQQTKNRHLLWFDKMEHHVEIQKRGNRQQLHKMLNNGDLRNVIFQDIDDDYSYGQYGEFDVIIMRKNGYINATKLCKDGGKLFKNWLPNKSSTELIQEIAYNLNISTSKIMIQIMKGENKLRGTYVHPTLITHIAYWCSTEFAVKVGQWIEEWKKYSKKNEIQYWNTIKNINFNSKNSKEKIIQYKLKEELQGQIEVETPIGDIDLLTDKDIIEIKHYKQWKHALGQILSYGSFYPDKNKYIYLFDVPNDANLEHIRKICDDYKVNLKLITEN